jgi:hypothetical protein
MERQLERMGLGRVFTPTPFTPTAVASVTAATSAATTAASKEVEKGPTGIQAYLEKARHEAEVASKRLALVGAGLGQAVADAIVESSDPINAANEALAMIAAGQINVLNEAFNASAAGVAWWADYNKTMSEELQRFAEQNAGLEKEVLEKRKAAFESFADSVKGIFGRIKESIMDSFTLPELGNSVNSITRNIKKLLERTREFARNITSLSDQGLGNELLQQIIAAGPMAGGRLAQALAGAGGGTISELNQAYGEFGNIASGIAGVGTRSDFGNAQVVNTYNIEVNGGVGSGPTIGRAIVDAIKSYERTSGAVWQGA